MRKGVDGGAHPLRLVWMTSFHCASFMRIASVSRVIPALFTSTPTGSS